VVTGPQEEKDYVEELKLSGDGAVKSTAGKVKAAPVKAPVKKGTPQ
jgi:hypothetical protein